MTLREQLMRTIRFKRPGGIPGWLWWDGEGGKYHSEVELSQTAGRLPVAWIGHSLRVPGVETLSTSEAAILPSAAWIGHGVRVSDPQRPGKKLVRDAWGCVRQYAIEGLDGQVVENPISSYEAIAHYQPPLHVLDVEAAEIDRLRTEINSQPDVVHKIGWMQLYERMRYLRPAEELYVDIALDVPELYQLRDLVMSYLHKELDIYLTLGVDVITFSEDWGTQTGLQISPAAWCRIFKPAYQELFDRVHQAGCLVEFHSCGCIIDIINELIDLGVEILNSQVSCMNLQELSGRFKGRICFEADFDRQQMSRQSPQWVRDEVFRLAEHFGSPNGGLFITAEVPGATSLANVEAFIEAITELSGGMESVGNSSLVTAYRPESVTK